MNSQPQIIFRQNNNLSVNMRVSAANTHYILYSNRRCSVKEKFLEHGLVMGEHYLYSQLSASTCMYMFIISSLKLSTAYTMDSP